MINIVRISVDIVIGAVVILLCICLCSIWTYCHIVRAKRKPSQDMEIIAGKNHLKLTELCRYPYNHLLYTYIYIKYIYIQT